MDSSDASSNHPTREGNQANVKRVGLVVMFLWGSILGLPQVASAATPKIAVIVLENKAYSKIVGSPSAPYLNSLLTQGKAFTDYHAITGGSAHDYRAMVAGETSVTRGGPNLFRAIGDPNWISLQESMGGNCGVHTSAVVPGTSVSLYTHGHDPAYMYRSNDACTTNDVPLISDSQFLSLPSFTFITPNMCDNMHTYPRTGSSCPSYFGPVSGLNAIEIGDAWLSHVVPLLTAAGETVFITFDEGGNPELQHVYAVQVGAGVTVGATDASRYDHYGLLAGLYTTFGLGIAPNAAASATPLPIPS